MNYKCEECGNIHIDKYTANLHSYNGTDITDNDIQYFKEDSDNVGFVQVGGPYETRDEARADIQRILQKYDMMETRPEGLKDIPKEIPE